MMNLNGSDILAQIAMKLSHKYFTLPSIGFPTPARNLRHWLTLSQQATLY
jgi:hypothetical protein